MIVNEPEIVVVSNSSELAEVAARRVVDIIQQSQKETGEARIALSGGSTPRMLFTLLAAEPYVSQVNWEKIDVFWGDERTVPPDSSDSNYRMACDTLLSHVPIPDDHIHRMRGELDPDEAAREYEQVLTQIFEGASPENPPRFDLILLGVGQDGHTASLFPRTSALAIQDRLVVANEVPQQNTVRLSLTAPVLLAAHNVLFLAVGEDKAEAVQLAIEGEWAPTETPCQFLREAEGHVIWLLDQAAASKLTTRTPG
jgi:6-phosphogluconolactonase